MAKKQQRHISNLEDTLFLSYEKSGSPKSFSDWIKDLRESFDQKTAAQYYDQIDQYYTEFNSLFKYLESLSDRYGYQIKGSLDIISEIQDRLSYISKMTGIQDTEYLNSIFHIDRLQEVLTNLADLSTNAYIFGGEQLGQIPGYKNISEFIGVQVSNGPNKATLEKYLLNDENSREFIAKMQADKSLTLMPVRNSNGQLTDLSFGVKIRARGDILKTFKDMGLVGQQLPINYEDNRAVEIVNAIIQGKSVDIQGTTYNFATKLIGANFGQRTEALDEIVYKNYAQTGQLMSGSVLESYVVNVLTRRDEETNAIKFNVAANTSGLAAPDYITALFQGGEEEFIQDKNIGQSRRFTYGTVSGTQEVMGFYGNIGKFNNIANQSLKENYQLIVQNNQQEISIARAQINSQVKDMFMSGLSSTGMSVSGGDEDIVSDEDLIMAIMGALG